MNHLLSIAGEYDSRLVDLEGRITMQIISVEGTQQRSAASVEMEEVVGRLLKDSFELVEQNLVDGDDLEAGCLSCS